MSAEDYVHRIGRTGRAGKSGRAFTIAAGKNDIKYIGAIEKLIGKPIPPIDLDQTLPVAAVSDASPAQMIHKRTGQNKNAKQNCQHR